MYIFVFYVHSSYSLLIWVAFGQVFSEYFGFPCKLSFHQMLHIHLSSEAGIIGQFVADVPNVLSSIPPAETKKKRF
jgi:hypothetical protein